MAGKLAYRASRETREQNRVIGLTLLVLVVSLVAPGAGQSSQPLTSQSQNAGVITSAVVKVSPFDFSRLSSTSFGDNEE
jgi:hypothetical protein